MWKQLFPQVHQLGAAEVRAKELKEQIVALEFKMKEMQKAGESKLHAAILSIDDPNCLQNQPRRNGIHWTGYIESKLGLQKNRRHT